MSGLDGLQGLHANHGPVAPKLSTGFGVLVCTYIYEKTDFTGEANTRGVVCMQTRKPYANQAEARL